MALRLLLALALAVVVGPVGALAAGGDSRLDDIHHVVIFMQENRAFDHYFGRLRGVRGFGDRAAITLPSGLPTWYQPLNYGGQKADKNTPLNKGGLKPPASKAAAAEYMLPWHMDTHTTNGVCGEAPAMSYAVDIGMWDHGLLGRWNEAREPGLGMSYFEREDLPYYYSLIDGFTVGDQYHQSTFTQTNPNRLHLFSGSNGLSVGQRAVLDNSEPGFNWTTMGEILQDAGLSWRVYQEEDNFDDNGFAWFDNFRKAKPGNPLYERGMKHVPSIVDAFEEDMAQGKLPQVSWIVAPTNYSEHANHMPPLGEHLSSRLIEALRKNPEVYKHTLFILNYDEGGQFYDHGWTPTPPVADWDGKSTVSTKGEIAWPNPLPIGLGFRVPLVLISPWSRGGFVCSEFFDHTSVIQLLERKFGVHNPNISPWRRAMTGDLVSCLDLEHADYTWPDLPSTSGYVQAAKHECATLPPPQVPAKQRLPSQEPGTRPSRALPYELSAHAAPSFDGFDITIDNKGTAGAPFYLYDNLTRTNSPKKYAVEAGKSLTDRVPFSRSGYRYAFVLHGPNGFVRSFQGTVIASQAAEVMLRYNAARREVILRIENAHSTESFDFALTPHAYVRSADSHIWRCRSLQPGRDVSIAIPVAHSGNWYDFSVTAAASKPSAPSAITPVPFQRRFMGRMETGEDSISDPSSEPGLNGFLANNGEHPTIPERLRPVFESPWFPTVDDCKFA